MPNAEGIFVCYRREDSQHPAGRLADALQDRFGHDKVFMDVNDVRIGNWQTQIDKALDACAIVIVVIGPTWLRELHARGDDTDAVRYEIGAAIKRNKLLVPVRVDGAPVPQRDRLPREIAPLLSSEFYELGAGRIWRPTLQALLDDLDAALRQLGGTPGDSQTELVTANAQSAGPFAWGLPPPLVSLMSSSNVDDRLEAVAWLASRLASPDASRSVAARIALERMATDENPTVAERAAKAVDATAPSSHPSLFAGLGLLPPSTPQEYGAGATKPQDWPFRFDLADAGSTKPQERPLRFSFQDVPQRLDAVVHLGDGKRRANRGRAATARPPRSPLPRGGGAAQRADVKEVARQHWDDVHPCPVCGVPVKGKNLVRHYDERHAEPPAAASEQAPLTYHPGTATPTAPGTSRGQIKDFARQHWDHVAPCPVCDIQVKGRNLIRHYDEQHA